MDKKNKHIPDCKKNADHPVKYNEQHDAYYCTVCRKWLEKKCGEPACYFCPKRPKFPPKG